MISNGDSRTGALVRITSSMYNTHGMYISYSHIMAFDHDAKHFKTLKGMLRKAGAKSITVKLADFLQGCWCKLLHSDICESVLEMLCYIRLLNIYYM